MKCQILNCNKEADLPYFCCSTYHGYEHRQIVTALEKGLDSWSGKSVGPYKITEAEKIYYSQFIRDKGKELHATEN